MSTTNPHLLLISALVRVRLTIRFISALISARPWLQSRLRSEILNYGEEVMLEAATKIATVLN
jgi:hypothetical protein